MTKVLFRWSYLIFYVDGTVSSESGTIYDRWFFLDETVFLETNRGANSWKTTIDARECMEAGLARMIVDD